MSDSAIPPWFANEWRRCGVRCSRWAGINDLAAGADHRRRTMQHFTLYVFTAGEVILRHRAESFTACGGHSCLLPPGWTYHIHNPGRVRCRWLEIQLELLLDRSLPQHPLYRLKLPAAVPNPPDVDGIIADFMATIEQSTRHDRDLLLRPKVDALIGHYVHAGFTAGLLHIADDRPAWVEEVLAAITGRSYYERCTITSIADEVGLAVSTIQHGLRRYLGRSFSQLQKERRIAEAQQLMASNANFTVADVARRCGYPSPGLFYRHFKEIVGHPPRAEGVG